ncbi:MAG: acetoacetate decarboxylase [Deltaproteobacteria bacterium]|nr:acetoacetate decarboxylase [Deltaproteobacteria bacterium]
MKIDDVKTSFAMPVTSPSFSRGPYRFRDREYLIIEYETDIDALQAVVPEPLEIEKPTVKYEFIKMPDSDGFGSYAESGQVVPVRFNGVSGNYLHSMYLDDISPIVGGREIWGFPKKYAHPEMHVDRVNKDCYIGVLKYGELEVARATMAYKWKQLDNEPLRLAVDAAPNFLLKVIPDVDGSAKICQLVQYPLTNITIKEAWTGPASLQLFAHCMAPVADLPVKRIVGALHYVGDMTIGPGKVVYDYLA